MNRILATWVSLAAMAAGSALPVSAMAKDSEADSQAAQITALKADIEQLRGQLPSQSHAMTDVDYQFTNLWFAAREHNWPLATFYLNETRSHITWTVRLRPVRKLASGQDLDLRPLLQAIEQSGLTEIRAALDKHDNTAFRAAYQDTLNQCYSCHLAAEKPFLHPGIPASPATYLIQMKPGK
jgi:hypothetical protein